MARSAWAKVKYSSEQVGVLRCAQKPKDPAAMTDERRRGDNDDQASIWHQKLFGDTLIP